MALFNIDNILEMANNDANVDSNSFSDFVYSNTNFLESAMQIVNSLKNDYHSCNLNLHKNAIQNKEVKYSTFMKEASTILTIYSEKINSLKEKALDQFKHYSKEYNLAELSLIDGSILTDHTPAKLNCMHNYSLMSIGEDFKESLPTNDTSLESIKNSIAICKDTGSSMCCNQRASYGSEFFNINYMDKTSDISSPDFVDYLNSSYFDKEVSDTFNYNAETVVKFANRINNDNLTSAVVSEFDSVFEDMQIGASAILGMVDDEISSEAVPYLSPTEEETKGAKNVYVNLRTSQFIESVCTAIIAAGYKADVLFETLMTYKEICNSAADRVEYLKENGMIDHVDIIIAEATLEV